MAVLENTIAIVCNTIFEPMWAGVEMTKVMFAVYISKVNTASEIFYILKRNTNCAILTIVKQNISGENTK